MRICHIWDAEYPWDVRVQKVSQALQVAGHEVHIVARNRKRLAATEQLAEGLVHRIPANAWMTARLDAATMFPAFFNPRWWYAIDGTIKKTRADLVLVRDLPLAPTAIVAARRHGIPVVLDMAENYGAMMQSLWDNGIQKPFDFLVRNPRAVRAIERWVLSRVDHTVVVVEESADRLMALGVPAHRISVVRNTPEASRLLDFPEREHVEHGSLDVVYLGLLEKPRGLETVIKAVAVARASGNNVFLNVIGDGRERRAFESLANELGVMDTAVRFRGYIPYAEALQALSSADVGIVPHYANESWNTTIPNKLFDYMSAGLAVISSNARPAARVVRETDAGEVYDYTDPDDLARAFARLRDPQRRSDCASNGRAAVRDQYNWSVDGARLATAIDSLAKAVD